MSAGHSGLFSACIFFRQGFFNKGFNGHFDGCGILKNKDKNPKKKKESDKTAKADVPADGVGVELPEDSQKSEDSQKGEDSQKSENSEKNDGPYRVLARKYRPQNFSELIGQDALVRTLVNAIASGRIAQAFMLTGVRGVGKTTTARIIAKSLNCVGEDGAGGPTATPCGVCPQCQAITDDRHIDVLEIDAASHNGVQEIREIIENVRYAPGLGRYKIFILDEVHMLSQSAFNSILKTLEEPPAHVKFIFATTEIRKVPVTVLSRCQRFDLARVSTDLLIAHYGEIAQKEAVTIEPEALALIAKAADGSVRDGLSLLDQSIALGDSSVSAEQVQTMLGLADRVGVYDLVEAVLSGDATRALERTDEMNRLGVDPIHTVHDLLEACHFLSRAALTPDLLKRPTTPELERSRATALLAHVKPSDLSRMWQLLLKGLEEVKLAPVPAQALDMVIMRLLHASHLPPLGSIIRKLESASQTIKQNGSIAQNSPPAAAPMPKTEKKAETETVPQPPPPPLSDDKLPIKDFQDLTRRLTDDGADKLSSYLRSQVRLVEFSPGKLVLQEIMPGQPSVLTDLRARLQALTGIGWEIILTESEGAATLAEEENMKNLHRIEQATRHPAVQSLMTHLPGAKPLRVSEMNSEEFGSSEFGANEFSSDEFNSSES